MDDADISSEKSEAMLAAQLAVRKEAGPAPIGECLFCGERLGDRLRWCSRECRDDFERARRLRK